jgi:hypothetical protein
MGLARRDGLFQQAANRFWARGDVGFVAAKILDCAPQIGRHANLHLIVG